jgi:hypothetical protein
MLSKITETAAMPVKSEVMNKTTGTARDGKEKADKERYDVTKGEIRKNEIIDGELVTKVYDREGRLRRVIPPGYLLAGEQKFNFTI